MPLLLVLIAAASYDASAGQSIFDLLKKVEDVNKSLETADQIAEMSDTASFTNVLGGIACNSSVKNASTVARADAFIACGRIIEALSAHLTEPELAEVQASTEDALTTGEDRTWTNDDGVKVETTIVKSETRTATVPVAMGLVQNDVSANKSIIIYTSPSKDSDLLAFLEPDAEIFVVGRLKSVDWYAVETEDNVTGFVEADSIQGEIPEQPVATKYVARQLTVIYKMASKESKLLAAVEEGEELLVVGIKGTNDWYRVQAAGKNPEGYVQAAALKMSVASPSPQPVKKQTARTAKAKTTVSNQQEVQKLSLAAATPADDPQTPQHAEIKDITVRMNCRTYKQTATLAGGESVVEDVTACKTPTGGWVLV
jgi:uncharacterized protein YgiM (DUF1202 family)